MLTGLICSLPVLAYCQYQIAEHPEIMKLLPAIIIQSVHQTQKIK